MAALVAALIALIYLTVLTGLGLRNQYVGTCGQYYVYPVNISYGDVLFIDAASHMRAYLLTQAQYHSWKPPNSPATYVYELNNAGAVVWAPQPGDYVLVACGARHDLYFRVFNESGMGISALYGPNKTTLYTDEVVGFFNITSADVAYSAPIPDSFTLQLNVYVAVVNGGQVTYHWFQNALVVEGNYYRFQAEVDVTHYIGSSQSLQFYNGVCLSGCFETPISGYLVIRIENSQNGPVVMFGYIMIRLGNITFKPTIQWFATYPLQGGEAYIVTSYELGPYGLPLDTEFVIAGPGSGGGVTFSSLNATLRLLYWNGSGLVPYQDTFSFAISTAEYAVNVHIEPNGPGSAVAMVGPADFITWN